MRKAPGIERLSFLDILGCLGCQLWTDVSLLTAGWEALQTGGGE